MATRRSSKRRTSRSTTAAITPPFVVDFYDGGAKSVYAASITEAMRVAKKHGSHDRPAVVWKLSLWARGRATAHTGLTAWSWKARS